MATKLHWVFPNNHTYGNYFVCQKLRQIFCAVNRKLWRLIYCKKTLPSNSSLSLVNEIDPNNKKIWKVKVNLARVRLTNKSIKIDDFSTSFHEHNTLTKSRATQTQLLLMLCSKRYEKGIWKITFFNKMSVEFWMHYTKYYQPYCEYETFIIVLFLGWTIHNFIATKTTIWFLHFIAHIA